MLQLFDTHVHLDHEKFEGEVDAILERALHAKVTRIITVSSEATREGIMQPVEIALARRDMGAVVGIHPHEASKASPELISFVEETAASKDVVKAVGEIGLDFHYDFSPRDVQREVFVSMLALGRRLGKPVVLHIRNAHDDALEILKKEAGGPPWNGVVHCFTEGPQTAVRYLDLGLQISFTGVLTFNQAVGVKETAAFIPLDRVMLETDGPYLAPVPHRGRRCEPAHLVKINETFARIRNLDVEETARITTANACSLFSMG